MNKDELEIILRFIKLIEKLNDEQKEKLFFMLQGLLLFKE